ncbi:MAG: tyrosine-type recombinase/integrase [Chloroflexi bacterium]|nr:tyrosine-type recombinase/integrase [Chloroflexota bacterium]
MTTATRTPVEERAQFLESFELAIDAAGLSPATLRLYRHGVMKLYAFLERIGLDAPLSSISAEHLREFLVYERQAGAAPATLDALHRAMRRFWRFLAEEGEVTENVSLRVPAPKLDVKIVEALSPEQIAALFKVCKRDKSTLGKRDEAIIAALLDTGLRAAELLSLTVEGIDWRERRALILGKGARERLVLFEAKTLLALQRYHRQAGIKNGALFQSRTGEPLSQTALYLAIRRRGEQAGIEGLHPHTFRHTCATRLLAAGMQESDVRMLLGWSRGSRMLERYTQSGAAERALEARAVVRLI